MVGNCSSVSAGELVCGRAAVSATQPTGRSADRERLLQHRRRHLPHRGNSADRRQPRQTLADLGFCLRRHQIAAVLAGAIGHRLGVERAQQPVVAATAHRPRRPICAPMAKRGHRHGPAPAATASATVRRANASDRPMRGMRSTFSVVTTSAPILPSISASRWSLASLKASKAFMKSPNASESSALLVSGALSREVVICWSMVSFP